MASLEEVKTALRAKGFSDVTMPSDEKLTRRLQKQSGETAAQQATFWAARKRSDRRR
jgi:hypothetical protein